MPLCYKGGGPCHHTQGIGEGKAGWGVEGVHAVTQGLLSILMLQCDRPLSLTSHLSAAALTCSVNTLSFLSLCPYSRRARQAHLLPSGGTQPLQVTLTHDRALACPSDRVWRGRREPEASWRAGRLWTPSAQPASPLNSVSDLLRVFPCVTLPSIQVVVQTNTTCLPSQSRAELHQKSV